MESKCTSGFAAIAIIYHALLSRSTLTASSGLKTRNFGTIISELTSCLRIHTACNSRLGGVSLEFTGELNDEGFSVTECLGGSMELSEEQLGLRYQVFLLCFLHRIYTYIEPSHSATHVLTSNKVLVRNFVISVL